MYRNNTHLQSLRFIIIYTHRITFVLFCFLFRYYYSYNPICRRRHSFRDEILIDSKYFPSLRLTDIAQMPCYGCGSVIIVKRIRIRRFARFRFYIQCKCAGWTTKQQRGKWLKFDTFFRTLFHKKYIIYIFFMHILYPKLHCGMWICHRSTRKLFRCSVQQLCADIIYYVLECLYVDAFRI